MSNEGMNIPVIYVKKLASSKEDRELVREMIEDIYRSIVNSPEKLLVTFTVGERTTVYRLECCRTDLGRVLGSKGKVVGGIRAVLTAILAKRGIRAVLEVPYHKVEE